MVWPLVDIEGRSALNAQFEQSQQALRVCTSQLSRLFMAFHFAVYLRSETVHLLCIRPSTRLDAAFTECSVRSSPSLPM